jgi:16S rRNA C967 or C1407 C5-methylase (RsmB/RsmF family)
MDYETALGPCAVAGAADAGCRLQRFVGRAFRERLGEADGLLHVGAKKQAAVTCAGGKVLVNGTVTTGRYVLSGGDVVTLLNSALAGGTGAAGAARTAEDTEAVPRKRPPPRMILFEAAGGAENDEKVAAIATPLVSAGAIAFGRYYREQRICSDAEWRECEALFALPVPLSLRLNRSAPLHRCTAAALDKTFGARAIEVPWMHAHGGALHVEPAATAEEAAPGLALVKLMGWTGEVVVQDSVSMLPAIALAPRPGDAVLDLCSAPGSKTCELLDAMHLGRGCSPQGFLVANDLRAERAARVWGRAKGQPCTALLVTAADAASFPAFVGFDRILVDVPCSSDGTIRKEPKVLEKWSLLSGLRHHPIQLAILQRAIELLRPGGRIVYSTCSLNPIEDEAVVRAALLADRAMSSGRGMSQGTLRLVPTEEALSQGCPRGAFGLEMWRVPDLEYATSGRTFGEHAEVPEEMRDALPACLFAGTLEESRELGLRHCARYLPTHGRHFQGFFLAVLERSKASAEETAIVALPLLSPLENADPALHAEVAEFFGLSTMPLVLHENLICLVSQGLSALLQPEEVGNGFKVLHAGTPVLRRTRGNGRGPTSWSICPEGAVCLARATTKRHLLLSTGALRLLLAARELDGLEEQLKLADSLEDGPVLISNDGGDVADADDDENGIGALWIGGVATGGSKVTISAPREVLQRYMDAGFGRGNYL